MLWGSEDPPIHARLREKRGGTFIYLSPANVPRVPGGTSRILAVPSPPGVSQPDAAPSDFDRRGCIIWSGAGAGPSPVPVSARARAPSSPRQPGRVVPLLPGPGSACAFPSPPSFLLPRLSLSLSASSFCSITLPQKEVTALQCLPSSSIAQMIAGSERSSPTTSARARRSSAHAGQYASVCCAVSRSREEPLAVMALRSFPILCRYSPKHPVSICVVWYDTSPCPRSAQFCSQSYIPSKTVAIIFKG